MRTLLFGITTFGIIGVLHMSNSEHTMQYSNIIRDDRMLLVLSAPSVHNEYYKEDFQAIVEFQKQYAKTVLGNDNVIVLVDRDTAPYYADSLAEDMLLIADVDDIWMRDFSTVHPRHMVQFTYDQSYFEFREDAEGTQLSFVDFTDRNGLEYRWEDFVLDGGNVVDNGDDKIVVTTRFLEENGLSIHEAKSLLQEIIGVQEVAIIEYDDDVMGHADGMVMWADSNTLLVNAYDKPLRGEVLRELESAFTDVTIVEVPAKFTYSRWRDFNSACGVNVNAVVTHNHIYVPTFNQPDADDAAIDIIRSNTAKTVHTVSAEQVCHMGGSVRCMSWQIAGENARKLILSARK